MNAYVGRCKCGAIRMAVVDEPDNPAFTAQYVAEIIKRGYKLEHIPEEQVRTDNRTCKCKKRK